MKQPRIEVICIGSELLTHKVNTHTVFLGEKLAELGFDVSRETTVGDHLKELQLVFQEAIKRSDVVLSAGGLGPTFDDLTREVWSRVIKKPLVYRKDVVQGIELKFKNRGIKMPPHNKRQGYFLKDATEIVNHHGTAPGQIISVKNKTLVLLPGPKRELYPMVTNFVVPYLKEHYQVQPNVNKSFHLIGVPESVIDEKMRPLVKRFQKLKGCRVIWGILASNSVISVKFRVEGKDIVDVKKVKDILSRQVRSKVAKFLFGEDQDRIESALGYLLQKKRKTLSVAESCTGGLISKLITDAPGSSKYFTEGMTTYSNKSKISRLGVKAVTLKKYGAVSKQVAHEMVKGLKKRTKTDFALSITGVAGPDGGTPEKPVGLVYMGCATPKNIQVHEFHFKGDREGVRIRSAFRAFEILKRALS